MLNITRNRGLVGETLRLIRATWLQLVTAGRAEPAPYWTDYLRETRGR